MTNPTICDQYATQDGMRELVLLAGSAGSRLLVDRRQSDCGDTRLLAHLAADEPDANAHHVCREYLADPRRGARRLRRRDFSTPPEGRRELLPRANFRSVVLTDAGGRRYGLRISGAAAELRWHREPRGRGGAPRCLSAREVIGALEAYEPVCTLSRAAVARFRADRRVSVATLSLELRRIESSPIVLNRRLREAVLEAVSERGVSFSAIAMACGRVKYDSRGNDSGETSWLARRVGLLPCGPGAGPNPWVHTDTLALIARDGLGIAPREVELP
ncbi:MAG TPA: hypothetical protein VGG41_17700 [Solirubrobacteraceae bacterium]|jgi:hypothetical protein